MTAPVYVLIRTSKRPKYFARLWASIMEQTYPNIITITHSDNKQDKYVKGDIIVRSNRNTSVGRGFFNLYCNVLLDTIPADKPGWYHFVDDDDLYAGPDVIERFVASSIKTHINVARSDRGGGKIWPKYWKGQKSFQTECFMLHSRHKNLGRWWHKKAGDHNYTKQITRRLQINWIEDLIVCRAQSGKGRGLRLDFGTPLPPKGAK